MTKTLDINSIRYLNLFEKITKVRTRYCFIYNNTIMFVVPRKSLYRAVGSGGRNIRGLSEKLRRKIKIIIQPESIKDAYEFFLNIVEPHEFRSFRIENDEFVISATRQNKAGLIGRNKSRLKEMQKIALEFFNKKLRII